MKRALRRGTLVAAAIAELSYPSFGATIRVPEDAPSVLVGVDQAVAGDSVLVSPGIWNQKETRIINVGGSPIAVTACAFPKGGISILSDGGAEVTTLDIGESTQGEATVIEIANQKGDGDILIDGFTLTGARGSIAAKVLVAVEADKVSLRSCRIVDNGSSNTAGNVVQGRAFELEMINCEVSNNIGDVNIFVVDSPARLDACRFTNNLGVGIQTHQELSGAAVSIENCEFRNNRWRGRGTCIDVLYSPNIKVRHNLFLRNVATEFEGSAMRASECSGLVEFNVFAYDSCLTLGTAAALAWDNSTGQVRNNTFVCCHGRFPGAAFVAFGGGAVVFEKNIVAHSTGSPAVNDINHYVTSTSCNVYWDNEEGDFGNWDVSPTDMFVDPIFCGFEDLDFTVREDSPCIIGGCSQVGALGVGCEDVSLNEMSWGRIKGLYRVGGKAQ